MYIYNYIYILCMYRWRFRKCINMSSSDRYWYWCRLRYRYRLELDEQMQMIKESKNKREFIHNLWGSLGFEKGRIPPTSRANGFHLFLRDTCHWAPLPPWQQDSRGPRWHRAWSTQWNSKQHRQPTGWRWNAGWGIFQPGGWATPHQKSHWGSSSQLWLKVENHESLKPPSNCCAKK